MYPRIKPGRLGRNRESKPRLSLRLLKISLTAWASPRALGMHAVGPCERDHSDDRTPLEIARSCRVLPAARTPPRVRPENECIFVESFFVHRKFRTIDSFVPCGVIGIPGQCRRTDPWLTSRHSPSPHINRVAGAAVLTSGITSETIFARRFYCGSPEF